MNCKIKNFICKFPPFKQIKKHSLKILQLESDFLKCENSINEIKNDYEKYKANINLDISKLKTANKNLSENQNSLNYRICKFCSEEKIPSALSDWFTRITGENLDLNNTKTYNQKIQWMKLYDSTPLKTRLADKYLVRDWVKEKIGEKYLIPLLGVWDSFEDINIDALPNEFVLKANHGCGWNIIVKDKSKFNINDAKSKFKIWMATNFAFVYGFEMQYKDIKPKIIAEQYIENCGGDLYDYKVFCFDGKPEYIMFLADRKIGLKMAFYNTNWELQPFTYSYPRYEKVVEKPKNLDELLFISSKLSEGFSHSRIDFYLLDDGTYKFGEVTFTSASGTCKWKPEEFNSILGDMIKLP